MGKSVFGTTNKIIIYIIGFLKSKNENDINYINNSYIYEYRYIY